MANWKSLLIRLLPPILTDVLRALKQQSRVSRPFGQALAEVAAGGPPEWEAVGVERWTASNGWLHPSIVATQVDKWKSFSQEIKAPMPFGRSHEANPDAAVNITAHNITMTFAYGVARALSTRNAIDTTVGILDWGGGIGHYASLVRELYPEVRFDYVIRELETLAEAGRPLLPDVRFVCDDHEALARSYDLIFASSSLQYSRDVYDVLKAMARTGSRWIMVCRMPFVDSADDFVVIQRPYRYGYDTEYSGWFLNRFKFVEFMKVEGYSLEREFLNDERPFVPNAPEQCVYRAYLFRKDA